MPLKEKVKHILIELKGHTPFTILGALLGILFMLLFKNLSQVSSRTLFAMFHPGHVLLSAMVTASMFRIHAAKKRFALILIVGYFGSVGIATLSDVIIPHVGSRLLRLDVPTHAELHSQHAEEQHHPENNSSQIHLGFVEEWYLVNPAAILGIIIAYFLPRTKFPHTGHVLVSTWASSSYLLMNIGSKLTIPAAVGIFVTLFIAIWLPCCVSDIIFPLLFVKSDIELTGPCPDHAIHSHDHLHKQSENQQ